MYTWQAACTTSVIRPSFSMLPVNALTRRADEAKQGHSGWHR